MPSTLPRCRTRSGPVLRHYSLRVERRLAGTVGVTHGPGAGSGAPHSRPRAADHAPAELRRPGLGITSDSDMDWSLCTTTLVTCAPPRPRSTTARLGRDPPQPAAAQEPPSSGARTWVRTPTPVPPGLLTPHVGARARHPSAPYPTLPGPSREGPSTSTATNPNRTRAGTSPVDSPDTTTWKPAHGTRHPDNGLDTAPTHDSNKRSARAQRPHLKRGHTTVTVSGTDP